jgi:hypothetical protein
MCKYVGIVEEKRGGEEKDSNLVCPSLRKRIIATE